VIPGSARVLRDEAFKTQSQQIQLLNVGIDNTYRVILSDLIVRKFGK
jgi:hypothetical protein